MAYLDDQVDRKVRCQSGALGAGAEVEIWDIEVEFRVHLLVKDRSCRVAVIYGTIPFKP